MRRRRRRRRRQKTTTKTNEALFEVNTKHTPNQPVHFLCFYKTASNRETQGREKKREGGTKLGDEDSQLRREPSSTNASVLHQIKDRS
jgi:hypothetical protein